MFASKTAAAICAAVALMASLATAQTTPGDPGADWSKSMSATFFTSDARDTLRSDDDILAGLTTMSADDMTVIKTQCEARQANGVTGSVASGSDAAESGAISDENMTRICELVSAE